MVRRISFVIVLGLLFSTIASAQTVSLSGRVSDPQTGVVVGASITLTQQNMPPRTTRSGSDGMYTFSDVPAGSYTLEVDAPGFQRWTQEVTVAAGRGPIDVNLQIAVVNERVDVVAPTLLDLSMPASTGSRLALTPLQTPASLAVIPAEVVRELGTPSLMLAKSQAPGIAPGNNPVNGTNDNTFSARGFVGPASIKQLYNGMELYHGGTPTFPFDPWNMERIEVLYGPASVLYGTGAIGGAVNVIPRRPDPKKTQRQVTLSGGRFGTYHAGVDLAGSINDGVSYQFGASRRTSDGWVERSQSSSLAVSGSLRFDVRPNLRVTVANDYGHQYPTHYMGTPVLNGKPVLELRKKNYNIDDTQLYFRDDWTTVETDWTPTDKVTVHNSTFFMYHDRIYRDVTIFTYLPATRTVRRTSYRHISNTWQKQWGSNGYLKYAGSVAGRKNDVLVGFDSNRNYYKRDDNIRGGTSTVDAFNFNPGYYRDAYLQEAMPLYTIHVNQAGAFLEDRLAASEQVSFVFGLRADHYGVNRHDKVTLLTTRSTYTSASWNVGTVYNPRPDVALYAQYAAASDPVTAFPAIGANLQAFSLSDGRQVEVGAKGSLLSNRFAWTLAGYRIVKENLLTSSVANPSIQEQVGQQSSRGFEASLGTHIGRVQIDANGAILKPKFDDFRASIGGAAVQLAGNVPLNVPQRLANLSVFWDAARNWRARSVVRYVGKRFSDNTNIAASLIPNYTVLDLGLRWNASTAVRFDFRIDNATNATYGLLGSTTQWVLGAPRSVVITSVLNF